MRSIVEEALTKVRDDTLDVSKNDSELDQILEAVSYTHLTLPTKRIV